MGGTLTDQEIVDRMNQETAGVIRNSNALLWACAGLVLLAFAIDSKRRRERAQ